MRWLRRVVDLPRILLMALVRVYRLLFSPWVGRSCRFEPSCSRYALEALCIGGGQGIAALFERA